MKHTLYFIRKFTLSVYVMTHIAKVIEIIGNSDKKLARCSRCVDGSGRRRYMDNGLEITDMTAKVDANSGNITEYHTAVKIAFGVEH